MKWQRLLRRRYCGLSIASTRAQVANGKAAAAAINAAATLIRQ
jgi:hypothetical protein